MHSYYHDITALLTPVFHLYACANVRGAWRRGYSTCKTTAYQKMMAGLSVFVNLLFSGGAYLAADRLIGSETMRGSFIKAGLFGKDLNKASEARV